MIGDSDENGNRTSSVMGRRVVMTSKVEEVESKNNRAECTESESTRASTNTPIQKIITSQKTERKVLVEGQFLAERFPSGISVMGGDIHELANTTVLATAGRALHMVIVLDGQLGFGYDEQDFHLRGQCGESSLVRCASSISSTDPVPTAVIVDIKRRCSFRRYLTKGRVRKINIIVPHAWFERTPADESGSRDAFWQHFSQHLSTVEWQPSQNVMSYCNEMLTAIDFDDKWQRNIYIETRVTAIIGEMVNDVIQMPIKPSYQQIADPIHTSSEHYDVLCAAIEYIESYLHTDLTLEEVAKQSAMSVSALQRKFKDTFSCTVFDYVRQRRLAKVKEAMDKEKITIGEAAYMAGYNHPSNFITAFKRQYGVTPGELTNS